MGSLRRRLLEWLLLATAVLGTLALIDTWDEAVDIATSVSDRVLAGSALAIAERVSVDEDQALVVDIPYSALEMLSSTAQDRVFYRIDGPNGLLTGYAALPQAAPGRDGIGYADGTFGGAQIRLITLARSVGAGVGPFTVTVAESTLARRDLAQTILLRSALRLTAMIFGAALIVWITVPLALRPLNRLSEAIAARSPGDLAPLPDKVPSEVQGLVEAVNSLMARLEMAMGALRNFTGNASHQLRTPLAVVRTQIALAARADKAKPAAEALASADAALAHAERVLAQLLLLARVDAAAGAASEATLDLEPLARDLTGERIPRAADAGIDLGFAPAPSAAALTVRAEPVLLTEALSNLIDNALIHAGSGAEVTVSLWAEEGEAVLAVEDDGPGIPEALQGRLTSRFARGDGAGLGLGLSIVSEIAALFGGRLLLVTPASGKGLRAELRLPLL